MEFTGCSFAHAGTYGHECGSPAVKVGKRHSDLTKTGYFYMRRCLKCTEHKGGENIGLVGGWIDYKPELHVNQWK